MSTQWNRGVQSLSIGQGKERRARLTEDLFSGYALECSNDLRQQTFNQAFINLTTNTVSLGWS